MLELVYSELEESVDKALKALRQNLMKVRTGRANLGILDGIRVEFYGTLTPLNQVGTLKVADPRLITIQPWDKTLLSAIEKAIASSDLGLNPSNDGNIIRIPIPPLTTERRRDLVKIVKRQGEETKVAVRNERRSANDAAKDLQKDGDIGEDLYHGALAKIQEITNKNINNVDEILAEKEKEIMEF